MERRSKWYIFKQWFLHIAPYIFLPILFWNPRISDELREVIRQGEEDKLERRRWKEARKLERKRLKEIKKESK